MLLLVTGGHGFVGRHLVRLLSTQGHEVHAPGSAEADLRVPDALDPFADHAYDRIYHLAAWTRAGRFCSQRGGDQWIVNEQINTSVLSWWARAQPQAKLVAFGTSASYSGDGDRREEEYMLGTPDEHYYGYAMTKRSLYAGLVALGRQHRLDYLYLVPSTVYGPDYHTDGRELHFVYDLARKILRGQRFGEPVTLWGDGEQRRELVYVHDYVEWVAELADVASQDIVNLGEGRDHSIRELAACICETVGFPPAAIRFDEDAFVGPRTKTLSTRRLDGLLPGRTQTPVREGVAALTAWVEAHLDQIEPRAAS